MNDFETFRQMSASANVIPVVETMPADLLTPLAVYLILSRASDHSFLFESVEGGKNLARYSFIGADPEMIIQGGKDRVKITANGETAVRDIGTIDFMRDHFSNCNVAVEPDLPSFIGGAIGFLGFDCVEWFEPSLRSTHKESDSIGSAEFMFCRSIVAFDHARQVIKIVYLVFTDTINNGELLPEFEKAKEFNRRIREKLEQGSFKLTRNQCFPSNEPTSNLTREEFENAVEQIKELIRAGECYQVVLSRCLKLRTTASSVSIYRAIRSLNPSPYMFLLDLGGRSIVGASPEMLVRCERGTLSYRPIAGTRPRGKDPTEDISLATDMLQDEKEVSEHMMLVDLGRNDLGRVAEYGTVKVEALMEIEQYSHVQHLVSTLSAKLRPGLDRFDALAACFPAGTVTGAPKVRAIEIIRSLEPSKRGVYAGAVGYFDYSGNMDTCIAIRTLVLENGVATIQAGAGIVADSQPTLEFEESMNKAKVLLRAVEIAESGAL